MYMFCCFLKILYYLVLIAYYGCDVYSDWSNFYDLNENNTFSGISLPLNNSLAVERVFLFSCFTGTAFSLIMVVAYGYYIKYHWYCIDHPSYRSARYSDGECSQIFTDFQCDKECDRTFVMLELWISILELFWKDDFQSGILVWIYTSQSINTRPGRRFIFFQACSVAAHLKLGICFMTKLCGCGAGEEFFCEGSCAKILACVIGLIGSVVLFVLTVVFLVEAVSI